MDAAAQNDTVQHSPAQDPPVLWAPDPETARGTRIAGFARWVQEHRGVDVDELDYAGLHDWSVRDLDGFWSAVAEVQVAELPVVCVNVVPPSHDLNR